MSPAVQHPPNRRAIAVLVVALAGFALLLGDLLGGGPITRADPQVSLWFAQHRVAWATALLFAITQLHSTLGIDCMLALGAAILVAGRRWRAAAALVVCVQGAMLLNVLLKTAFARARPDTGDALVHLLTYSFPSGHALASTVWWGCVTWLVLGHGGADGRRVAMVIIAAAMVALTCLSRIYLGAHYLSDVLAGACEGAAWLAAWALLLQQPAARRALSRGP